MAWLYCAVKCANIFNSPVFEKAVGQDLTHSPIVRNNQATSNVVSVDFRASRPLGFRPATKTQILTSIKGEWAAMASK
jgi:hypothetical protein